MASTANRPSPALISAAVSSLVGGVETRMITSRPTAMELMSTVIGRTAAELFPQHSSSTSMVDVYFSSMVPAVSTTGDSIPRITPQGILQIETECLAPESDHDFTNKHDGTKKFTRGNHPYVRPCGSYRIALKVKDKFGTDNAWLGMTGTAPGEWPVSYHGTAKNNALNIAEDGFKLSKGARFRFGEGIYSTPELDVAKRYATEFSHDGASYLCILQNRVNPKYLKVIPASETGRGTYWLSAGDRDGVNETELLRPYGICLFKKD